MDTITIRTAAVDDAAALLAIYAPYVKGTAITFEYEVPSLEEFQGRIAHTLRRYPYIVAVENGEILGYAYTGPFGERAPTASRWRPASICGRTFVARGWASGCMPSWSVSPRPRMCRISTPASPIPITTTPI